MNEVSFILAFAAGILSFLSPCVLPLVPAYISYLTGTAASDIRTDKDKSVLLLKSIGFVIGFSLIFIIMGASFSLIGRIFSENRGIFRTLGGIFIIVFGIHTTGLLPIKQLYYEKRILPFGEKSVGSVFLGMAFAAGWTPCIGPILSTILIYAGNMDTIGKGILLLLIYSLGLAIPFLLTAFVIESFTKSLSQLTKYLPAISMASGILMILMGILMVTNKLTFLSGYLNFINIY